MDVTVVIYGMPPTQERTARYTALKEVVQKSMPDAVKSIECIGDREGDVFTFTPADVLEAGLGEELIAFIETSSTIEDQMVRFNLAEAVRDVLVGFAIENLPKCKLVKTQLRVRAYNDISSSYELA